MLWTAEGAIPQFLDRSANLIREWSANARDVAGAIKHKSHAKVCRSAALRRVRSGPQSLRAAADSQTPI
jgi:hypothetical protein